MLAQYVKSLDTLSYLSALFHLFRSFPGLKSSQERDLALDNVSAVYVPCALLAVLAAVHRKAKYHM